MTTNANNTSIRRDRRYRSCLKVNFGPAGLKKKEKQTNKQQSIKKGHWIFQFIQSSTGGHAFHYLDSSVLTTLY